MINNKAIDWLEIISASDARRSAMRTSLCTVDTGGQVCFGVRVDEQWVVGQEVAVLFDSAEAASRFLSMVGLDNLAANETVNPPGVDCRSSKQCFHISKLGGLGTCPRKKGFIARDIPPANDERFLASGL